MFLVMTTFYCGEPRELLHMGVNCEEATIAFRKVIESNCGEIEDSDFQACLEDGYTLFPSGCVVLLDTSNVKSDADLFAEMKIKYETH